MSDPVKVWFERDGRLLRLRLDRPKANSLDAAMISALDAALTEHGAKPGLQGILIDAEGQHFSFGAASRSICRRAARRCLRAFTS